MRINIRGALITGLLLLSGFTVLGQQTPSLEERIKQKEAELRELKEQRRQERIKELKAELERLEADTSNRSESTSAPTPVPSPAVASSTDSVVETSSSQEPVTPVSAVPRVDLKLAAAPSELIKDLLPTLDPCQLVLSAARPGTFSRYEESLCGLARDIDRRKNGYQTRTTPPRRVPGIPSAGISLSEDQGLLLPIMLGKLAKAEGENSFASFILEADEARTDKQVGGGPSNSGTTSLAVKGGVPSAFGWALEHGGAVSNVNGNTLTFRFNPVGAVQALSGTGFIEGFRHTQQDPILGFFRRSSVGLSFDTSRGDEPGTFTGKNQLSAISFRYEFLNEREPRLKRYQRDWEQFVATEGVAFATTIYQSTLAIQVLTGPKGQREYQFRDPALESWLEQTNELLSAPGLATEAIRTILVGQLDLLPVKQLSVETTNALTDFGSGLVRYSQAKKEMLDKIAKGRVITFEYTNDRAVNAPDTSNFRFIAEGGTSRRLDLTVNASLTIFNRTPVLSTGRVRDFQFAGQLDVPIGDLAGLGQSVVSFSGRYERLMENAFADVGLMIPNTKGDIGYGQLKLTIPIKGTGVRIPFSVTFSNRTELIKEKEIRGNFGFTFDLDTLLARFKPF